MLFNSYAFIFVFLPASLALYWALGALGRPWATAFLGAASLFFYGWWNPAYLGLLGFSIVFNYGIAAAIARTPPESGRRRAVLVAGISGDLAILAWFKYADFALSTLGAVFGTKMPVLGIVLPIGISFFTFTQIAFLVDTAKGSGPRYDFPRYLLFVTFFPHLLAGPLFHHEEMMPQFADPERARPRAENLSVGLTIFIIGLAKKAVLADGIAGYAAPVFAAAAAGGSLDAVTAWGGALAYTFQLYFDFSGYSDMAIGAARCFGILLPLNFHSPYKSTNIVEFWRRWHMTLSRFLLNYLYIPLGGNRRGRLRRYLNLIVTMLLGGLWHGAAWTFVAWGALHGIYLVINHAWVALRLRLGWGERRFGWPGRVVATSLTFIAVVVGWVLFRATSFAAAIDMLAAMFGRHGFGDPRAILGVAYGAALYGGIDETAALAVLAAIAFLAPNTQQLMKSFTPSLPHPHLVGAAPPLRWQPSAVWAVGAVAMLLAALSRMSGISPFLYYQF